MKVDYKDKNKDYHFTKSQLLLNDGWITNIQDNIIVVYVITNNLVSFNKGFIAWISYIVRTCKNIIVKIAFVHDSKANFIRNHSM